MLITFDRSKQTRAVLYVGGAAFLAIALFVGVTQTNREVPPYLLPIAYALMGLLSFCTGLSFEQSIKIQSDMVVVTVPGYIWRKRNYAAKLADATLILTRLGTVGPITLVAVELPSGRFFIGRCRSRDPTLLKAVDAFKEGGNLKIKQTKWKLIKNETIDLNHSEQAIKKVC
jgi:hypothetical protein